MILVTGGTGFIGQALIQRLVSQSRPVRALIRPSSRSPGLPQGIPVQAAISSITDARNVRAALVGVETVFHTVGAEWLGVHADFQAVEIEGTRNLIEMANDAGVKRIFYLSHLGADRASAYPVLKAKGIAERFIQSSGLEFTIIRTSLVYGPRDNFSTQLLRIARFFPLIFPLPSDGGNLVQPVFIDDLVTCLVWSLENQGSSNKLSEIGGPEYFSLQEVVEQILVKAHMSRRFVPFKPSYMRFASILLEYAFPNMPFSTFWLDYLSANRTCAIDSIPRQFGLLPSNFSNSIGYLATGS
ncbi:MAG: NAD(P)H-binding protein [Anaerolineae bacterium]|nr:NAD(P)H-binding protein [Anaerolineae bacterium]